MMHLYRVLLAAAVLAATVVVRGAEAPAAKVTTVQAGTERKPTLASVDTADDLILLERSTRSLPPVEASPDEGTIARLTASMLMRSHYLRRSLDDTVSAEFLEEYLDTLDNLRLHFLQTDVEEFGRFRTRLDDLTRKGDTSPGRDIFERFLQRVEERVTFVAELLKSERFSFEGDDRYAIDRRKAARPQDIHAARALWRQHLRYEVLQEKLSAKPKPDPAASATAPGAGKAAEAAKPKIDPATGLDEEIVRTISRRYARLLRTLREFDGAEVFQLYLTSLTHVYDPHSDYLGKPSLDNFAINMNLSLFGIGAVLQSEDGYCKVRELRPGPAMRSKQVKPGDRIIAVGQGEDGDLVDVVDMKLNKVVELIRGPKGSPVRLTLIPVDATDPSERRELVLVRDEIKLEDEEARAKIVDLPGVDGRTNRVGVIDLPSFYASIDIGQRGGRGRAKSTTIDVARLLSKLKEEKVEGVILDLRRNGGGSLEEAIDLTGLFIKEGPVVQVRDFNGRVIIDEDPSSDVLYDGPLIVLTSRFSASASEILAGALQDYGRALIVGDSSTHGKGTVQSLVQLQPMLGDLLENPTNNPGALKITVRKFYRASGASTQLQGVRPDIVLPSVSNFAEVGEGSLDHPLAWDTIDRAPFEAEGRIAPVLDELRRRSEERVKSDKDFDYTREDIALYRKHLADKSVSLNEAVRRREKEENEQRAEARKQERKSRPPSSEQFYDITLKEVGLPGLPPPGGSTNAVAETASRAPLGGPAVDDDEGATEDKDTALDVPLKEAKRILLDLIELSRRERGLARSR